MGNTPPRPGGEQARIPRNLDLVDFPTIVWYEVEYSVYTMRQASRRSWRIGQRLPVQVIYFAYRGTLQAEALALVARKLQASLAVEGELVEDGLAAHGDEGEDLLLSLARSLTEQVGSTEDSLEGLFAGVRKVEADAEAGLNQDDLAPEGPQVAAGVAMADELPETELQHQGLALFREEVAAGNWGNSASLSSTNAREPRDEVEVDRASLTHGQQLRLL